MEVLPLIAEVVIFIALCIAYYKLCLHRNVSRTGKTAEIISLYLVTVSGYLGNIKFIVWALCIAAIGVIKFLTTTKKLDSERKSIGNHI